MNGQSLSFTGREILADSLDYETTNIREQTVVYHLELAFPTRRNLITLVQLRKFFFQNRLSFVLVACIDQLLNNSKYSLCHERFQ